VRWVQERLAVLVALVMTQLTLSVLQPSMPVVVVVVVLQVVLVEAVAVAVEPLLEPQTQAAVAVATTQQEVTTLQLVEVA
jgi:hypothetical protein